VQAQDQLIGRLLGPLGHQYEIIEVLGRGAGGVVYRARQLSLPRQVAVKVLDPVLAQGQDFTMRFRREAEAIAGLEHACILPVYDFGQDNELLYLVMRLVRGGSVKDRFEWSSRQPWPPAQALVLAQQILPALDYAHRAGVVHRDVKPANILLEGDTAYLADFGIAKLTTGLLGAAGYTLTAEGFVGTPSYVAPEQVMPDPAVPIDGRADVYAFGVVLHELLTGRLPFQADDPIQMALQHVTTPAPPARLHNPALSAAIETVLARALAKAPAARFATAADLLANFEAAVRDVATPTPSSTLIGTTAGGTYVGHQPVISATRTASATKRGPIVLFGALVLLLALALYPPLPEWIGRLSGGHAEAPAEPTTDPRNGPTTVPSGTEIGPSGASTAVTRATPAIVVPDPRRVLAAGDVVLADNFEEAARTQGLWPATDDPTTHRFSFDGGEFVVQKLAPTPLLLPVAAVPGPAYADAAVAVDARLGGEAAERYIVMECRMTFDDRRESGYRFAVMPSTRQFWVGRLDRGQPVTLLDWRTSQSILTGAAGNRLEFGCQGNVVTAGVNGAEVARVQDGRYQTGQIRLGVGTLPTRQGPAEARFDNLVVVQK
jgi:hypothetical protein